MTVNRMMSRCPFPAFFANTTKVVSFENEYEILQTKKKKTPKNKIDHNNKENNPQKNKIVTKSSIGNNNQ